MDRRDRVMDWQEEFLRIEPQLPALPPSARKAVHDVVACFLREDAEQPVAAQLANAA